MKVICSTNTRIELGDLSWADWNAMFVWCRETVGERHVDWDYIRVIKRQQDILTFRNNEDLLAFRLRFGV